MPIISISFDEREEIHGLSFGHITVTGNNDTISTTDDAHHNVMVFITLSLIWGSIETLMLQPNIKAVRTTAVDDGDFEFLIRRANNDKLETVYRRNVIDLVSEDDFKQQIWSSADIIYNRFASTIESQPDDVGFEDFSVAYHSLKNTLGR